VIAVIIAVAVVLIAVLAGAAAGIKIVREYQRVVLFRLGRSSGARGPGLIVINPITDRVTLVDLREQFLEVPHQVAITQDNASIAIDFIIFTKVFDPVMSVLAVRDFRGAALKIAATTLRAVVGDMTLDEVLSKREEMNNTLRFKLDDVTERWGVKVTNVEVREINPPPAILDAMTRQMSAERTRRAVVTEAEGTKQAAITVAEGQKQSAILAAEGDRQSAIVQAEGFALALKQIQASASSLDPNTMTLQYFDALKKLGASPATKFVVPMELTQLLNGLAGGLGQSLAGSNGAGHGAGNGAGAAGGNGAGSAGSAHPVVHELGASSASSPASSPSPEPPE
jgi:regulator of protease activity HflC (stomatin/prohibitin superfamily)